MPFNLSKEKLVPTAAIRELTNGSFEHFTLKMDDAIAENAEMFGGSEKVSVARLATFSDRVVVGTSDGRVLSSSYTDDDNGIRFGIPEHVDVPVVDTSNAGDYVNKFMMDAVNALLMGSPETQKESVLALMNLQESVQFDDEGRDLASLVNDILTALPDWKAAYRQNIESIKANVSDVIESVVASQIESKYAPLYNGTMPEERFHLYLESARKDLSVVADRLLAAENKISTAYSPFAQNVSDKSDAIKEFAVFSEGVMQEVHDLREHARIAIENEQCAMCIGQIHDALAESLTDYEIATSFIEKMATRFAA